MQALAYYAPHRLADHALKLLEVLAHATCALLDTISIHQISVLFVIQLALHVRPTQPTVFLAQAIVIWMQTLAYYAPHHLAYHALKLLEVLAHATLALLDTISIHQISVPLVIQLALRVRPTQPTVLLAQAIVI